MIDIKLLRENPDLVKENIKKKFQDNKLVLVDEVLELDVKNREAKLNGDNLRSERKSLSNQIGSLMREGKKEEAEKVKAQVNEINSKLEENEKLDDFMYHKSRDSYYNQKHEGEGWAQKGVNWFHDPFHKKEEDINYNNYAAARNEGKNQFLKYYNTGEKEDIQPVDVTTNIASKSSKKAQEQTQTLKEQELNKQAEKALVEPQPQEETTPQFTQVFSDNDDYNYSYSDIGLSQRQYDAMTNNSINLSGVN